ncbi:MAG TPA: sigma-54 dependent transcriptional regulator [Pyrinomonadaceae bacterium]|nr:sigma-54 dependent transcriptional regulator [Pyrinomonadaceae bacterium]
MSAKILLLDFTADGQPCAELRAILAPSFELLTETVAAAPTPSIMDELAARVSALKPDVIFVALAGELLRHPGEIFGAFTREAAPAPCIVVSEEGGPGETFELLQHGAVDFVTAPLREADVLPRVWRLLKQTRRAEALPRALGEKLGLRNIIGESPTFLAETRKIPLVAKCDACVLIYGETGTGKEVYARAIHYLSPREHKPFIPVNCGAIPLELVENELFGHERGAFTGAGMTRPGLLREAEGGTLFLDEIDCLPPLAQVKLLRFIQEKEYRPLGSTKTCRADVRIIGAANVNFEEAVRTGKLRKDLYYRLSVIKLALPPLRERREDIPLLARHFLKKYSAEFGKPLPVIPHESLAALISYDWPGNVRELEHVIECAFVFSEQSATLSFDIHPPGQNAEARPETFQQAKNKTITQFEREYIQKLLLAHGGNITRAAHTARKNRRAFWELIRKHRIDVSLFK